ncbi:MAG: MFS transporter [Elusimicrobia bacterium]|nr:MFS transporter [Elusimicrobiota bacterium]
MAVHYDSAAASASKGTWKFPRTFWFANLIELFERAAYYGCFIFLAVYLTSRIGFTDKETGLITGIFSFLLYLMPTFMGTLADKIGFRKSLCAAFLLLTCGYAVLGAVPTKSAAVFALLIIVSGAAIVKPVVSGTVAKCSDEANRARAFSLFYWAVNIGAFSGKSFVDPIRQAFANAGDSGALAYLKQMLGNPAGNGWELQFVNLYAACMAFAAFLLTFFAYREVAGQKNHLKASGKNMREIALALGKAFTNWRFACLIIITGFFWAIQGQLYATMPKYLFRMVGLSSKPGWIANVNPFVVVLCVIPITQMVRFWRPVNSIAVSFLIIPLSALSVALAPMIGVKEVFLGTFSVNTIILMMIIGIMFQGLAECFLSPKYLEYASKQAPAGETGLYMGFAHLNSAFGWFFGFVISGILLDKWCPDPARLPIGLSEAARGAFYAHAHYIWYVFTGIGLLGFALLMAFRFVTDRLDRGTTAKTAGTVLF